MLLCYAGSINNYKNKAMTTMKDTLASLQMYINDREHLGDMNALKDIYNYFASVEVEKYDECFAILAELVAVKKINDTEGKTLDYMIRQPIVWDNAKKFVSENTPYQPEGREG